VAFALTGAFTALVATALITMIISPLLRHQVKAEPPGRRGRWGRSANQ